MSDPADLARGWFRKGDSDLATARLVAIGIGPYDTACFHAQQAAEKYLKGFLSLSGQPFPFTHNADEPGFGEHYSLVAVCASQLLTPD
jgi:HEPN domain-containing protein